jgi:glycosyltransferase involved in cell wall biosynthesis
MNVPAISVILPAYNCEKYIARAIESVLHQTFTNFELIIIDDGSTDRTGEIIKSFTDPRILYQFNSTNKGLVFTLNKGIGVAKARYIARMDGDDISFRERFEKQLNYLNKNNHVDLLATVVTLIDENDHPMGTWKGDEQNINEKDIRKYLAKDNCIAHPSVMGKIEIFKKYKYNHTQSQSEDYDLWLRMISGGVIIHKLPEPLLQHRILASSFTRANKKNVFWRIGETQLRFAWQQFQKGKLSLFALKTFMFGCIDMVKGFFKQLKTIVKQK